MANYSVIDADGHLIEQNDILRAYLKAPYDRRGGALAHQEPWDGHLNGTLPRNRDWCRRDLKAQDWLRIMDEHGMESAFLYSTGAGDVSRVRERPIYFSVEAGERLLPETLRYVGEEHFVYASDIPHWDNEFPDSMHKIQAREDLSPEAKRKILYDNARAMYRT